MPNPYRTIGIVNVHGGQTTVSHMDREALKRIRELEREIEELKKRAETAESRARAAESRLAHAHIIGSAA